MTHRLAALLRMLLCAPLYLVAASAVFAQPPDAASKPEIKFEINWFGARPDRLRIAGGHKIPELTGDGVDHSEPQLTQWATYDLFARFGREVYPLRIVAAKGGPSIYIGLTHSAGRGCTRRDVTRIFSTNASTVDERLALLMEARHLLLSNSCADLDLWKLAKRYYDTSCALARSPTDGFELSEEAAALYQKYAWRPQDIREAKSCSGTAQARALRDLEARYRAAIAVNNYELFQALIEELSAHGGDERWAPGFAALRIDADYYRGGAVNLLYAKLTKFNRSGEFDQALALSDRLLTLHTDPDFAPAFEQQHITVGKLCADRTYILNRQDQGNRTADTCMNRYE